MEGKDERDEHEARKKQARLGGKEGDGSDEAHSLALTSRSPRLRCMGKSTHLVHLHALVHLKLQPPTVHPRIFLASKAHLLCMALLLPIASHRSRTSSFPIGLATTPPVPVRVPVRSSVPGRGSPSDLLFPYSSLEMDLVRICTRQASRGTTTRSTRTFASVRERLHALPSPARASRARRGRTWSRRQSCEPVGDPRVA